MLNANDVKDKLTTEDIIKICCHLQGSHEVAYDSQQHPIFNTCLDHEGGDAWKLYYYPETKLFHCYTTASSGSYDIFELVVRATQKEFKDAFQYVVNFFNLKDDAFVDDTPVELTSDWSLFQRAKDLEVVSQPVPQTPAIAENILEYFQPLAAPLEWQREGISPKVMRQYGIRLDVGMSKIVIPHRDIDGRLIGIRGRSFNPMEIAKGNKYMPVFIENDVYKHSLGLHLYGLCYNKNTIIKGKKAFIVESEKSVMQLASMYGCQNCWAVATCGSSFSQEQMNLLLNLGVEEVILGYDREFQGGKGAPDTKDYEQKLLGIVAPLLPYVNVSIVMDYNHLTPYKASPTDCGREIFEKLYHSRIHLGTFRDPVTKKIVTKTVNKKRR